MWINKNPLSWNRKNPSFSILKLTIQSNFALVIFFQEGSLLNRSDEERLADVQFAADQALILGFDFHATSLGYALTGDPQTVQLFSVDSFETRSSSSYDAELGQLFTSVRTLTAKEDLLQRLRQSLLALAATKLQYRKVFLGTSAARLASQLLTAVAHGRGAQIADEIVSNPLLIV